jgi:hypothetical protein
MRVWLCDSFSDVMFADEKYFTFVVWLSNAVFFAEIVSVAADCDGVVGKLVDKTLFDEGVACFVGIVSVDAVCVGPADVV